jgi:hypothetical protein
VFDVFRSFANFSAFIRLLRHFPHYFTDEYPPCPNQIAQQLINFGLIVATALMIWNGLKIVTGSESPIVVVLRYTMPPTMPVLTDLTLLKRSLTINAAIWQQWFHGAGVLQRRFAVFDIGRLPR